MWIILTFFVFHWFASLAAQSLFLHRYCAHGYYKLSPLGEKIGHLLTFILQGSSYLSPYAYGILHMGHHSYSDTEKDPHSPHVVPGPMAMMWKTACEYTDIYEGKHPFCQTFRPHITQWKKFDDFANNWIVRIVAGAFPFFFYVAFAPSLWWFLLVPVHWVMGPLHGFIVNYFGHKLGYRNEKTPDKSVNTLAVDFLMMGELYQNNHHAKPNSPCFARRWWEIDFGFILLRILRPFDQDLVKSGRSIKRVISEGTPSLTGGPQKPVPRLT